MDGLEPSICHHLFDSYDHAALSETFERLAGAGFHGVELLGEPSWYPAETASLLRASGLQVTGLTAASRVSTGRDLVGHDENARRRAREHLLRCCDFANEVGTNVVGVAMSAVGRFRPHDDPDAEATRVEDALAWVDNLMQEAGMVGSIEVLNRFSSAHFTAPTAAAMAPTQRDGIRLTLDSFHLLTETRAIDDLVALAPQVANLQVSGGARGGLGSTLIDPSVFVEALIRGGYRGPVTLEAFPLGTAAFTDAGPQHAEAVHQIAGEFLAWWRSWEPSWRATTACDQTFVALR